MRRQQTIVKPSLRRLPFGRYRRWSLNQVPVKYLQWLLKAYETILAGGRDAVFLPRYKKPLDPAIYADIKTYLAELQQKEATTP